MATSILFSVAPYHIISYGTLLGTTFFHSFVNGIIMFRTLQRPDFSAVQRKIFPIYFSAQTFIPLFLALTFPASKLRGIAGGLAGIFHDSNHWTALAPLAAMLTCGAANLLVMEPLVTQCMADRWAQEKKDGKRSYDPAPHSDEMSALNKRFGKLHGISSIFNLGSFVATVAYGFDIARRLQ
ncbi:putative mitochondrial outer membrane protein YPR098C [Ceratocystis fimbriata CBS 114723]|uniref:Putative mitochondrial outer membrane protein YPR098C n=1 Tax=Ceratocystis fimbriata CBS 114723 TaxID=1035309 RepID=A0A2C5XBM7_9PEZI|nr:putative mitochondrial outer membrane protein YPR098C [Ceratocystis fimbriata CBS 114723]